MSARILDGKALAAEILENLREQVRAMGIKPCVVFVRVGEHPASLTYVKRKHEVAESLGIESRIETLPQNATQEQIIALVNRLGGDDRVHGILVQSPLPEGIRAQEVFNAVPSHKDVDGFSALNLGRLAQGDLGAFLACTPLGILTLLEKYNIPTAGRHIVVVGRSLIVGRPLSLLLSAREGPNGTVTSCNKETQNLQQLCRSADILIVAAGAPGLVRADWVKPGATVIDVGITRVADKSKKCGYRLQGDVDFDSVAKVAGAITPVPGGVGPMTVAMLMSNTVKAARLYQIVRAGAQVAGKTAATK